MKYLNLTVLFEGENLNYGESVSNILSLKKISSRGSNYSYISRQAIRYDLVRLMRENFDMPLTTVHKDNKVIQFKEDATIDQFPEIDFFGYMKTDTGKIRKAVIRLSDALSLEPYNNDLDFSTNKGLADRIPDNKGNDIFQSEFHKSYYSYTITADLDKIGVDPNYEIEIKPEERGRRMQMLLDCVKLLSRDIRGKRENLAPVFVIGGLYDTGNPFFYNRLELGLSPTQRVLKTDILNSVLALETFSGNTVGAQTTVGYIKGVLSNVEELSLDAARVLPMEAFFKGLKQQVAEYYA